MLEKTIGNTLVTKLRVILLMKVDFNATSKIWDSNAKKHMGVQANA
jgi:hypothetical protein